MIHPCAPIRITECVYDVFRVNCSRSIDLLGIFSLTNLEIDGLQIKDMGLILPSTLYSASTAVT